MTLPDGVRVAAELDGSEGSILSGEAVGFVASLERIFGAQRRELLERRKTRQVDLDAGGVLGFLPETGYLRESLWRVPAPAPGLEDRRVEITGPPDRRMAINALNSGARVWMADFEDANSPRFDNLLRGQQNLQDALDGTIAFRSAEGREYRLGEHPAQIMVRPRGWHLPERHLIVDGEPVAGSFFDYGLYVFHVLTRSRSGGPRPYFYLPKLESHGEARLWDDVFSYTEDTLGCARGTIRATVLIETILAAFEMEEILFELRDHSAGLNAGRWDYLFSLIKKLHARGASYLLPDRNSVTMNAPFMRAYSDLLVATCHRRGAHAIGGMAAFIPSRRDPKATALALAKVREDKEREAAAGFDGSWVAHPDLVATCEEAFDAVLEERPNQLGRLRPDVQVSADQLLDLKSAAGAITEAGLRNDLSVALQYLASWLRGAGAVAIFNLMEDAATAEIARAQVWQWLHEGAVLEGDRPVDRLLVEEVIEEEYVALEATLGPSFDAEAFAQARALVQALVFADQFVEFLTLPAYELLDRI